ncbi:cobalamin biosynthesis protein CbiX [Salinicola endophyticus]|uniref:Cobalamin biosynthesis protein CbiX n=1 Tax=Salinicola endophyticus TaxID=1949083 RepID=A0ABY8FG10_9GAMM|nr:CbiX/SirB N-terminal domain-containing protein [Salinicola endophyticus]WFF41743.1 cobalamin biosynthesis protein CbiX [Salinicola endophyticus]
MRKILLVDNGSLRPAATLNLRRLAEALSQASGEAVEATSLLHSFKIPPEQLGGHKAVSLGPLAERHAAAGVTELLILPFFFGPSQALTRYLPERLAEVQANYPQLSVKVAPPLIDTLLAPDLRLAQLLADNVRESMTGRPRPQVVLVDHGSPIPEVTAVRNYLTGQLSALLADEVACVTFASMERREGDAYRFNEPLLEDLLASPALAEGDVILAMLFLSPGRHAGEGGDIAEICTQAMSRSPGLSVETTRLVGENDAIVEILATRLQQALAGGPLLMALASASPPA